MMSATVSISHLSLLFLFLILCLPPSQSLYIAVFSLLISSLYKGDSPLMPLLESAIGFHRDKQSKYVLSKQNPRVCPLSQRLVKVEEGITRKSEFFWKKMQLNACPQVNLRQANVVFQMYLLLASEICIEIFAIIVCFPCIYILEKSCSSPSIWDSCLSVLFLGYKIGFLFFCIGP